MSGTNRITAAAAAAGLTILISAVVGPTPASALSSCIADLGSTTTAGGHVAQQVKDTTPIGVTTHRTSTAVYPAGLRPALSSSFSFEQPAVEGFADGYVVIGSTLYQSRYAVVPQDERAVEPTLRRVGGGWNVFTAIEKVSVWTGTGPQQERFYGLRNDGTLLRWSIDPALNRWTATGSYAGLPTLKAIALIAKNTAFDTFLGTTRGGRLSTIRIPVGTPMAPVVTEVRPSSWQGLETLVATGCGDGVLLVGIDKDTRSAHLYSVGHANGTATTIAGRGKVPGTFGNPGYFRWARPASDDVLDGDG